MSTEFGVEQKLELITRHAACEVRSDWDGALATMIDQPYYEFYPLGLRVRGRDAVVEMWKRLAAIPGFVETLTSTKIRNWVLEDSIVSKWERILELGDGQTLTKTSYGLFHFSGGLIESETILGDSDTSAFVRPAFDEEFLSLPGVERLDEA
jgi:hypothetical protein